ncbi:MAG: hypothetical protein EON58_07880 [Alphaproteobacteria bacterium]|nr:MAG: hypothetical protein EON58_07880 [Alphaproteobacteria bacterium]
MPPRVNAQLGRWHSAGAMLGVQFRLAIGESWVPGCQGFRDSALHNRWQIKAGVYRAWRHIGAALRGAGPRLKSINPFGFAPGQIDGRSAHLALLPRMVRVSTRRHSAHYMALVWHGAAGHADKPSDLLLHFASPAPSPL